MTKRINSDAPGYIKFTISHHVERKHNGESKMDTELGRNMEKYLAPKSARILEAVFTNLRNIDGVKFKINNHLKKTYIEHEEERTKAINDYVELWGKLVPENTSAQLDDDPKKVIILDPVISENTLIMYVPVALESEAIKSIQQVNLLKCQEGVSWEPINNPERLNGKYTQHR